jgi:glutamyl-tRNA synthetase
VRLMELVNVEITSVEKDVAYGRVHSFNVEEARKIGAPIVQWVLEPVEVRVVKPVAVGKRRRRWDWARGRLRRWRWGLTYSL